MVFPAVSDSSRKRQHILAVCEKHWERHRYNCSGFVRAVSDELGVFPRLAGPQANQIYKQLKSPVGKWKLIGDLAPAANWGTPENVNQALVKRGRQLQQLAAAAARNGDLVVAASYNGSGHGHVAIVVDAVGAAGKSEVTTSRAIAYWGRLPANWEWQLVSLLEPAAIVQLGQYSLGVDTKLRAQEGTPKLQMPDHFSQVRTPILVTRESFGGRANAPITGSWKPSDLGRDVIFASHTLAG